MGRQQPGDDRAGEGQRHEGEQARGVRHGAAYAPAGGEGGQMSQPARDDDASVQAGMAQNGSGGASDGAQAS